ncbi:MAG: hypothetical protein JJE03_06295 [Peptostreptococcaceae bacterium]|nr:hypothetical protein [Peptostreptococcaceae bacterium]
MASYLTLTLTEKSFSIPNNNSVVNVKMTWTVSGSTHTGYTKSGTITIDGTAHSYSVAGIDYNETKVVYNADHTIAHDETTGAKTLAVSANLVTGLYEGTISTSGSIKLTTIPRISEPTLNDSTVWLRDQTVTIYTNRKSTSFTHTITYSFGGATGTIATGVGVSTTWTPPISLASQIPNATSGSGTITCKTYDGGTLIGTKPISIFLSVPSDILPSIDSLSNEEVIAGLLDKFGGYVKGKSKINAIMSASGIYGSTIKSSSIKIAGTSYSGINVTSGILQNGGTVSIIYSVTDTRNRTVTSTVDVIVFEYSNPVPASINAYRCNADGSINAEGTYAKVVIQASISPVDDKNDISYKVKYKKTSEDTYTEVALASTAYTLSTSIILSSISDNDRYDIILEVQDYFVAAINSVVLPTAFTLIDYIADGTGIAFGKVAEKSNCLEIELEVCGKGILDYVYPIGSLYFSVNSTSPATLFGGTWVRLNNTYLYGDDTDEALGGTFGSTTHTHTTGSHVLSLAEMPYHRHYVNTYARNWLVQAVSSGNVGANSGGSKEANYSNYQGSNYSHNHGSTASSAHYPPSTRVAIWKRTA